MPTECVLPHLFPLLFLVQSSADMLCKTVFPVFIFWVPNCSLYF